MEVDSIPFSSSFPRSCFPAAYGPIATVPQKPSEVEIGLQNPLQKLKRAHPDAEISGTDNRDRQDTKRCRVDYAPVSIPQKARDERSAPPAAVATAATATTGHPDTPNTQKLQYLSGTAAKIVDADDNAQVHDLGEGMVLDGGDSIGRQDVLASTTPYSRESVSNESTVVSSRSQSPCKTLFEITSPAHILVYVQDDEGNTSLLFDTDKPSADDWFDIFKDDLLRSMDGDPEAFDDADEMDFDDEEFYEVDEEDDEQQGDEDEDRQMDEDVASKPDTPVQGVEPNRISPVPVSQPMPVAALHPHDVPFQVVYRTSRGRHSPNSLLAGWGLDGTQGTPTKDLQPTVPLQPTVIQLVHGDPYEYFNGRLLLPVPTLNKFGRLRSSRDPPSRRHRVQST